MWESDWKRFVDELPDDHCPLLLNRMGLTVPGFRKGAKNIPPSKARAALRAAPQRHNGKPFLDWFQKEFGELVSDLESLSAEEFEKKQDEYLKEYPPRIISIAIMMTQSELHAKWQSILDQLEAKQAELQATAVAGALERQNQELTEQLATRERELEEARKREKSLETERRKLSRKLEQLAAELEKFQEQRQNELRNLQSELDQLRQENERLHDRIRELQERNEQLSARVERYREARRQDDSLFQLYRSLSNHLVDEPEDVDRRVLLIGDSLPVQYFRVHGKTVRIDSLSSPGAIDEQFLSTCQSYDKIVMLSSCPHKVRLRLYRYLGGLVTEIGGLSDFGSVFTAEEGLA